MFEMNDYVFYGSGGVCRIVDIQLAPLDGMPKDRLYYVLHSVHDQSSVTYIPVDSDGVFLRSLISREEANALLEEFCAIDAIEEQNAKLLRDKYNELMRLHTPRQWVRVIKTVQRRLQESRRISETERAIFDSAKKYLYTELSLVLELPIERIAQSIEDAMPKKC